MMVNTIYNNSFIQGILKKDRPTRLPDQNAHHWVVIVKVFCEKFIEIYGPKEDNIID